MTNHYAILGIQKDAKAEQIKKAYFEQAKKYHPDSGDPATIGKFHEVAEAYKILSDPVTKKAYDLSLDVTSQTPSESSGAKNSGSASHSHSYHPKQRDAYRDEELKEFNQHRYQKALVRVIGFTILLFLVSGSLAILLNGIFWLGGMAGFLVGLYFSVHSNFNVRSFFNTEKTYKFILFLGWFFIITGIGYFVWLIVRIFFV